MKKILKYLLYISLSILNLLPSYAQSSDTLLTNQVPTINIEHTFYKYDTVSRTQYLSYNYSNLWDLDGDKINDSIVFIGNGGAHALYYLSIVLSKDGNIFEYPYIELDMPYLNKVESLNNGFHSGIQFIAHDFDADKCTELYININTSFESIPDELKTQGITSPHLLIEFIENEIRIKNFDY